MKIAIDGGGLCLKDDCGYGNYTFSKEIIRGLSKYDKNNDYLIYSFCQYSKQVSSVLRSKNIYVKKLIPKYNWMAWRVSLEEFFKPSDVFLALNQAFPLYSRAKIIVFSHGLSFYYYRQFYKDSYSLMKKQLRQMIKRALYIVVSSRKIRDEFMEIEPKLKKVIILPFGIPQDMIINQSSYLDNKIMSVNKKYFLYVGMDHKIKNVDFIIDCFLKLVAVKENKDLFLYLVGVSKKYEKLSEKIKVFPYLTRKELRMIYKNAFCLLTASLYESFNFPVLEALSQGCQVIGLRSAIIPEFDSYVNLATNREEFLYQMREVKKGKKKIINLKNLKNQFSWEKYIKNLLKLYV